MTNAPDQDAATLPADPQHQCAVGLVGIESEGIEDVVIERDPMICQKPLAHIPLEEIGEDVLLPFHLVAVPHRMCQQTYGGGAQSNSDPGHVLVRWAEIEGTRAEQEDHLPMSLII